MSYIYIPVYIENWAIFIQKCYQQIFRTCMWDFFKMRDHIYESLCLCVQDQNVAVRREGMGLVLDSKLPHLIGIDDDILSTGIMLYHLKVGHANIIDCINFILPLQHKYTYLLKRYMNIYACNI